MSADKSRGFAGDDVNSVPGLPEVPTGPRPPPAFGTRRLARVVWATGRVCGARVFGRVGIWGAEGYVLGPRLHKHNRFIWKTLGPTAYPSLGEIDMTLKNKMGTNDDTF